MNQHYVILVIKLHTPQHLFNAEILMIYMKDIIVMCGLGTVEHLDLNTYLTGRQEISCRR